MSRFWEKARAFLRRSGSISTPRPVHRVERTLRAIKTFIFEYAEARFKDDISLHEGICTLILMRRHIWLYAVFQVLFVSDIEQQQTTESLNRTILMFDYIFYLMAEKYDEFLCRER